MENHLPTMDKPLAPPPPIIEIMGPLSFHYHHHHPHHMNGEGRESNKLRTYSTFKKSSFTRENYLDLNLPIHKRKHFTKLRISAHDLHIEIGRYNKVQVDKRICSLCSSGEVEDEFHFMLKCNKYSVVRNILINSLRSYNLDFSTDMEKFTFIMSCNNGDHNVIKHVLRFVNSAMEIREHLRN